MPHNRVHPGSHRAELGGGALWWGLSIRAQDGGNVAAFHLEMAAVQLAGKGAGWTGSCSPRPAGTCPNSLHVLLEGTQIFQ